MTAFQRGLAGSNSLADFLGLLEAGARRQQQGELDQSQLALQQEHLGLQRDNQARLMEEQRTEQARLQAASDAVRQQFEAAGVPPPDPRLPLQSQLQELQTLPDKQAMGEITALIDEIHRHPSNESALVPQLKQRVLTIGAERGWPEHVVKGLIGQVTPQKPVPNFNAMRAAITGASDPSARSTARTDYVTERARFLVDQGGVSATDATKLAREELNAFDPVKKEPTLADKIRLYNLKLSPFMERVKAAKTEIDTAIEAAKASLVQDADLAERIKPLQSKLKDAQDALLGQIEKGIDGTGTPSPSAMTEAQIEDATTEFITKNPNATDAEIKAYAESLKAK